MANISSINGNPIVPNSVAANTVTDSMLAQAGGVLSRTRDISNRSEQNEEAIFDILLGEDVDIKTYPSLSLGLIRGTTIDNPTPSTTNGHSEPSLFDRNFKVSVKDGYSFVVVVHNTDGTFNTMYPSNWTTEEYSTSAIASSLSGKLVSIEVKKTNGGSLSPIESDIVCIETSQSNKIVFEDDLHASVGIDLAKVFHAGMWNANGTYTEAQTQSQYSTEILKRDSFTQITVSPETGFMANVARFNGDSFVSRGTWVVAGNTLVIDNTYDVSIIITKATISDVIPISEMITNFSFTGTNGRMERYQKPIDFLYKIMNCDTNAKVLHFSFDDVISILKALDAETYSSIFEQYMLYDLKSLHDEYGCVFTLNCFCSDSGGFDISQLTTMYAEEFQQNKDWLRFSFHAEDSSSNYADASTYSVEPSVSYGKFVSGIYRLTGDYDCIDRFARLGYFGGDITVVNSLREASHGIIGLYSDDDTRASYYLDGVQNSTVINKGKLFDGENEFVVIRSLPRLDNNSAQDIIDGVTLPYQKYTEVFGHEYSSSGSNSMKEKISDICEWAESHGYEYGYFDKIFD